MSDDLLTQYGGSLQNSLTNILGENFTCGGSDPSDSEPAIIKHSPYFDIDTASSILSENNQFNILSLNVCSLSAKLDELKNFLHEITAKHATFQAICVQESWLSDESDLSAFHIDGFTMISQGKKCSAHGGLVIYLKNEFSFEQLLIPGLRTGWEGQFVRINKGSSKNLITLCNIYRPPNDLLESYSTFSTEFSETLTMIKSRNHPITIAGDFNIDLLKIKEKSGVSDFFDSVTSNGFFPKITLPTRLSTKRATLIDNFYCNLDNSFIESKAGIIVKCLSDHLPYFMSFRFKAPCNKNKIIEIYEENDESINYLKHELHFTDLCAMLNQEPTANPCKNFDIFNTALQKIKDKHFIKKKVKFRKNKHKLNPWISKGIIKSINFRDKLYMKLKRTEQSTPTYENLKTNLKSYNRILKHSIKLAKRHYYSDRLLRCNNDMKRTWGALKDILNLTKNKKTFPECISVDDSETTDRLLICEEFNHFFTQIGPCVQQNIQATSSLNFNDYLKSDPGTEFHFSPVNKNVIADVIGKIKPKQSCGLDSLSVNLLKAIKDEISDALVILVNQTLATGIFPASLKIAKVIPIYKKGDINDLSNYRPISVLPVISKIYEKIIANQINEYFLNNKLFIDNQYGFRNRHSTELAALEIIDRTLLAMDRNECPIHVYLDLSKAFDTIDHNILIAKLQHYGIKGVACSLFKSYLSNRKQCVRYDEVTSSLRDITTGVPQGSILGPLLFIIYINDIVAASDFFNFISYADDTTLFFSMNSFTITDSSRINAELSKISKWLSVNKLALNVNKSKYMVFHTKQRQVTAPTLIIDEKRLECVDEFELLGIVVDKHLKWQSHINKIATKVSKTIGIISRLKNFVPQHYLRLLYSTLILPHFTYGILTWAFDIERLFKLQKRAIRIITSSKYNAHTEPLFKQLDCLKLPDIIKLNTLKFYYKLENNLLPKYFVNMTLVKQSDVHSYNTRNKAHVSTVRIRHAYAARCVRHSLTAVINNESDIIMSKIYTHSIKGFEKYAKNKFIDCYKELCTIENCYICQT